MNIKIVALILSFAAGSVVALINGYMLYKSVKGGGNITSATMILRQVLNFGCLGAVFFLCRNTEYVTFALIGAALGLTIPSFIISAVLTKQLKNNFKEKGDENNGQI